MGKQATYSVDVRVEKATEKALLVRRTLGNELPDWIPKSQIDKESEISHDAEEGDEGTLIVSEWIADQKGWL